MEKKRVLYALIQLRERGEERTVAAVRRVIGHGSHRDIRRIMDDLDAEADELMRRPVAVMDADDDGDDDGGPAEVVDADWRAELERLNRVPRRALHPGNEEAVFAANLIRDETMRLVGACEEMITAVRAGLRGDRDRLDGFLHAMDQLNDTMAQVRDAVVNTAHATERAEKTLSQLNDMVRRQGAEITELRLGVLGRT